MRVNCEVEHPVHTAALEAGMACPLCQATPRPMAFSQDDPWRDDEKPST